MAPRAQSQRGTFLYWHCDTARYRRGINPRAGHTSVPNCWRAMCSSPALMRPQRTAASAAEPFFLPLSVLLMSDSNKQRSPPRSQSATSTAAWGSCQGQQVLVT